MGKKQLAINIIASFVALTVSIGINLFLGPYIIKTVGVDAYGFISLLNNFVSYTAILTMALNSMAGRFIAISVHQNDYKNANEYYSSTFFSNLFCMLVLIIPSTLLIVTINKVVNVPNAILLDVQILMCFLFANFLVGLLTTNLGISYIIKNKLYLSSLIGIESSVLKALMLVGLFAFLKPKISYMGIATFIVFIFTNLFNLYYKRKLLPELKISRKHFNFKKIKILVSAGIWNSITTLGQTLLEGTDLLIANLFISPATMGILAIAKTIPIIISSFCVTLLGTFSPNLIELHAKDKKKEFIEFVKQSMKIIGIFISIPISILISFGDIFFKLWVPSQDATLLQILSVITVFPLAITGPASAIHSVFNVINKLKVNSILLIVTGIVNFIVVIILIKTTTIGVFAIAGVSVIFSILRNLLYTVPYGAKYIGCRWYTFFPNVLKSVLSVVFVSGIGLIIKYNFIINSWITLLIFSIIIAIIGLLLNFIVVLNKSEKSFLLKKISKYLKIH